MLPIDLPIEDSVSSAMKHAADTEGLNAVVKSVADRAVASPPPHPSIWDWILGIISDTATGNIVGIASLVVGVFP